MRKIYLITLMSLITVLMAGIVHGAATCTITDLSYIYPDANFSITIVGAADNITNATIDVTGCTTTKLVNTTRTTNNTNNIFNFSIGEATLATWADETLCTMTGKIYNDSNGTYALVATCTTETNYPDTSAPQLKSASPTDLSKDTDGTISFSYACGNASSATLYVEAGGQGYTTYTMTESSDTCTYSNLKIPTNGFHSWYILASDGLNTTTSPAITFEVRRPGGYIYDEEGNILGTVPETQAGENKLGGLGEFIRGIINIPVQIIQWLFSMFQ